MQMPNHSTAAKAATTPGYHAVALFRRFADWNRSPEMRAERAKPESRKDDMKVGQGQRGTSAALGERYKMISSLFSNLVWRAGAPNQIGKRRGWVGVAVYPGRRPRHGLLSCRPCRGSCLRGARAR